MSASGVGILQHDLAGDILELFFEAFDKSIPPETIAADLEAQLGFCDLDDAEKEVFATATIECHWRIGHATLNYELIVSRLKGCEAIKSYWGDHCSQRARAVERLMTKIKTARAKPRKPKVPRKQRTQLFWPGDCVVYRRENGKFVPLVFFDLQTELGIEYLFTLPRLSKDSDQLAVKNFLRTNVPLTEYELAALFGKKKSFRLIGIRDRLLRANLSRFCQFGNRDFLSAAWSVSGWATVKTIIELENQINGIGCRTLNEEEIAIVELGKNS